jgi:hypothetical protein
MKASLSTRNWNECGGGRAWAYKLKTTAIPILIQCIELPVASTTGTLEEAILGVSRSQIGLAIFNSVNSFSYHKSQ